MIIRSTINEKGRGDTDRRLGVSEQWFDKLTINNLLSISIRGERCIRSLKKSQVVIYVEYPSAKL